MENNNWGYFYCGGEINIELEKRGGYDGGGNGVEGRQTSVESGMGREGKGLKGNTFNGMEELM